jgi:tRNA-Thr(GGU) m(6)t(6)A37 methyltransferase TsaA
MTGEITFRPIGVARTTASDEEVRERGKEITYRVEVFPQYEDALEGIDGFSHLIVMFHFDRLRPDQQGVLRVQPRKFLRRGLSLDQLPWLGVFSLDSPSRPNPMGFSIVKFLSREGRVLVVKGLEAFDGSPVIDIKPYSPDRLVPDIRVPRWYDELEEKAKEQGK